MLICTPMYTSYTSFAIDNSLHFSRTNRYFVDREKFKINMDFVSMRFGEFFFHASESGKKE